MKELLILELGELRSSLRYYDPQSNIYTYMYWKFATQGWEAQHYGVEPIDSIFSYAPVIEPG